MHILQSPAWQTFQTALKKPTFTSSGDGWSYLATLESTPLGPYIIVARGPAYSDPKSLKPALTDLKNLAKEHHAFFIRIEPEQQIPAAIKKSLKKVKSIHPEHTWVLDLKPSEDTLLAQMKQNNRNLYKNYAKKGLKITSSHDPADAKYLFNLLKGVARHNHIQIYDLDYYKKQLASGFATLYLVHYQQKIIAASLVYDHDDPRYYGHAAADYAHRNLSAGTVLLVHMILEARSAGKKFFDFWGITPSENPNHPWYGFTKFKKSFGGYPVEYPGTYDLILNRPKYALYSIIRPINRTLRRLIKRR